MARRGGLASGMLAVPPQSTGVRPRASPALARGAAGALSGARSRRRARDARALLGHLARRAPHLPVADARLSRAACAAHLQQFARLAEADLQLGALRAHHRLPQGLLRLRQRRGVGRADQHALPGHRAAPAGLRDLSRQRADVHPDEPRAGPRGDGGHVHRL